MNSNEEIAESAEHDKPECLLVRGLGFGVIAAIGYTAANVFLRGAADQNPYWVSGVKSICTFLVFAPWIGFLICCGKSVFPSSKSLRNLLLAAMLGQFGGNVTLQIAFGLIGLAISVPICLGTMITASAVIGRVFGHEPLKKQVALSIPVFLIAIGCLSLGRMVQDPGVASGVGAADFWGIIGGCLAAAASGLSYSVLGFAIRQCTHEEIPVTCPIVLVALVGALGLAPIGAWQQGVEGLAQIPLQSWTMIVLAGICNALSFLALTYSLKMVPVIYVHLVNSSQVAMAAIAGALIFAEPISLLIGAGVILTALGFIVMSRQPSGASSPKAKGHSVQASENAPIQEEDPGADQPIRTTSDPLNETDPAESLA